MRVARTAKSWTRAWGLALFSVGIFHILPTLAKQSELTDQGAQGSAPQSHPHKHHHYQLVDIGTFGGPASDLNTGNDGGLSVNIVNNQGALAGWADTATPDPYPSYCFYDCYATHAFRWQDGVMTDLGALADGVSSQAVWISASGLIVGVSENGEIDPLISGFPENRAVLWQEGSITDLGTLPEGGYESFANAVNSRGQVVGLAENTTPDLNSLAGPGFFPTQTRAFIWDQKSGMGDLGTLGTGTDAQAIGINEHEQVIGDSYTSSAPGVCASMTMGAFIWDHQHGIVDLGSFGGTCTLVADLNNRGQVVGVGLVTGDAYQRAFIWQNGSLRDLGGSLGGNNTAVEAINENGESVGAGFLPGETTFHATLWRQVGKITDLGVLGQHQCSFASSINVTGEVVGASLSGCTFDANTSAFLWARGSIVDLNTLIPAGAALHLQWARGINDRGEIAGTGLDAETNVRAFVLIPCDENHPDVEGCDYSLVDVAAAADPSNSAPMTDGLAAAASTQHLTSSEILAAWRTRMLRLPNIPRAAIHAGVSSVGSVTVSDSQAPAVQKIAITSGTPPQGMVGRAYDVHCHIPLCGGSIVVGFPLAASGGVPPYSWTWTPQAGSSLPPSLSISHHFGLHGCVSLGSGYGICGTPTIAGSYNVTVKVTDSASPPAHAMANYTIRINGSSSAALSNMIATPP
jgi:probable HAF family extracellular repeat protein